MTPGFLVRGVQIVNLENIFPFLQWRREINKRTTRADILAGITGAIIVLPQGVAFAMIAGLPPQYGMYAAIVPTIIAALFGSSFHLISGPTTAISIVLFTTISPLADPMSAAYIHRVLTLTFMAGIFQMALGLARLGALTNFVSHSVVVGFTTGAAILISASQLSNFFGVPGSKRHAFLHVAGDLFDTLPHANGYVLTIAFATLITALLFKRFAPRMPGMLFAMIAGSALSLALNGKEHGVRLVGSLPQQLPPLSLPVLSASSIRELAPAALAVAMLGLTEAVSIARSVATRSNQRIDSNQEFIGQGLSNIIGSFFSSYAASGSFTRTGVNYESGAKTPLAAVFAALSLAAILLLIAPLTAYLPFASMAAILLIVAYNLVDFHHIRKIVRTSSSEAAVLGITFTATLLVELEFAIYAGVLLSLVLYLNRTSHPHFITMAPDPDSVRRSFINIANKPLPECPQMKIIRVDGSLFFGAVSHFSDELRAITKLHSEQTNILIICSGINFIDVAGCEALVHEAHNLHLNGRQLYLSSIKGEVRDILKRGGYLDRIGMDHVFLFKEEAIKTLIPHLDPERCHFCKARIFNECSRMPGAEILQ